MARLRLCPFCAELLVPESEDYQQWQCACCGSWVNKVPDMGSKERLAMVALAHLLDARALLVAAGSRQTLKRIDMAISSARGAIRAAGYRDSRVVKKVL